MLCYYSKTGSCDEVAVLCMEVLANLCRCSVSVRAHIKGQVSFTNTFWIEARIHSTENTVPRLSTKSSLGVAKEICEQNLREATLEM